MTVREIMVASPRACDPEMNCAEAAEHLWAAGCGALPVIDRDRKVIGIVTDRDICMGAYTRGLPLSQIPVLSGASTALVSVRESDSLEAAEDLMQKHRIRRLPVLDDAGRPVGILSMNDLARRAQNGHRRRELSADAIARTLAAVCAPNGASHEGAPAQ